MFDLSALKNILDDLIVPPIVSDEDKDSMLEIAGELIEYYVKSNPLLIAEPTFHEILKCEVFDQLKLQVGDAYRPADDIDDVLDDVVNNASRIYFAHVVPRRSYMKSIVIRKPNVEKMRNKVQYLRDIPQPDQRTPEWYEFRHSYLTASSIWKAYSTQGNRNQLIYGKCQPIDTSKYSRFNLDSSLHWGVKYEDLSIMWYEREYCTKVEDFGCIPHSTLPFLAASPDGINVDESSGRFGRMLEVKNIVNREITGIPKFEYWIQMQIQMEVCNLSECDFLETRFLEYEDADEYFKDGTFNVTSNGKPKGIMLQFMQHGSPVYKYSPWDCDEVEFKAWEQKTMSEMESDTCQWLQNIYWRLDQVSVVLVVRNKLWFDSGIQLLKDIWDTIVKERETGYQHRAPRKRARYDSKANEPKETMKCLIDLSGMDVDTTPVVQVPKSTGNVVISIDTEKQNNTNVD